MSNEPKIVIKKGPNISLFLERFLKQAYPEVYRKAGKVLVLWANYLTLTIAQIRPTITRIPSTNAITDLNIVLELNTRLYLQKDFAYQPMLYGVLAHEFSHVTTLMKYGDTGETMADEDAIARGLGHYLAISRALMGAWDSYDKSTNEKGEKDQYLGYNIILRKLTPYEKYNAERLLDFFGMTVKKYALKLPFVGYFTDKCIVYDSTTNNVITETGAEIKERTKLLNDIQNLVRELEKKKDKLNVSELAQLEIMKRQLIALKEKV